MPLGEKIICNIILQLAIHLEPVLGLILQISYGVFFHTMSYFSSIQILAANFQLSSARLGH